MRFGSSLLLLMFCWDVLGEAWKGGLRATFERSFFQAKLTHRGLRR